MSSLNREPSSDRGNSNEVAGVAIALGAIGLDLLLGLGITKTVVDAGEGLVNTGRGIHEEISDNFGGDPESGALGPLVTVPEATVVQVDVA